MTELLSKDECLKYSKIFETKFAAALNDRSFHITAQGIVDGVHVTVLLSNPSGSFHYPVEARMLSGVKDLSDKNAAIFLLDYIAGYFEEYLLHDNQTFLPIDWSDFELDEYSFQMRGQIANLELEKMADAILARGEALLS